ncbi:uncharacterized protein EMH_0032580 [Eimeria mitis]|uniref:Methyltransferase domain-containing protein n=1 Tax=Eimeria mitis TaxID=44415 RepID=U6JPT4_9EIME|nr:uncharacterized protein EMH_0032580 [Eimeria mitis]CDJ27525.1 hypothetical protein, conserved [Eimeria mitis]
MPDDKPFEENTEKGLEAQQSSDDGEEREAEEQLSRHAFHSTWEEIYQRELHNATARKAYQTTNQHKRTSTKRQADCRGSSRSSSSSRSSCGSNSDSSSDRCSIDGEEWFGPECGKILNWVLSTLSRRQDHPLQLYFRRVHAVSSPDSSGAAECRGGACDWCRGEGSLISQEFTKIPVLDVGCGGGQFPGEGPLIAKDFTKIPVLDVGCGGGQFLVRLRRCGFERLAGIDYSHSAIQLARSNVGEGPLIAEDFTKIPVLDVGCGGGQFLLYVQCMHRLMPQYGLLFLTSCNCTLEDLESLFCAKTETTQQQQHQQQQDKQKISPIRPRGENKMHAATHHAVTASAASSEAPALAESRHADPDGLARDSNLGEESLFCAKTETTQQQQHQQQQDKQKISPIRPRGENKMHADATHHAVTASAASSGAPDPDGLARNSNLGEEGNTPTPKMPLFEHMFSLLRKACRLGLAYILTVLR